MCVVALFLSLLVYAAVLDAGGSIFRWGGKTNHLTSQKYAIVIGKKILFNSRIKQTLSLRWIHIKY